MEVPIIRTVLVVFGIYLASFVQTKDLSDLKTFTYINESVDPCQDFYEYTCGNFKTVNPLENGATIIDHFTLLELELTKLLNVTLSAEERKNDPVAVKKAKATYQACLNLEYIDTITNPELIIVEDQDGFPLVMPFHLQSANSFTWKDLGRTVSKYGIPMIFEMMPYSHPKNSSKNVLYIYSDSMANPSLVRPYHELSDDERIEKSFMEFSERRLLRGGTQPFDVFLKSMALKIRQAEHHIIKATDEEIEHNIDEMATFMRNVYKGGLLPENKSIEDFGSNITITLKQLNHWTVKQFGYSTKMNWVDYVQSIFSQTGLEITEETEVLNYVKLPELIYGILNLVQSSSDHVVKNFVMMRIFLYMAIDGDYGSRTLLENYYKGIDVEIKPRWQYCTRKIMDSVGSIGLSLALAYEYQLKSFDMDRFSVVVQMVRDLQNSFKSIIDDSEWMDEDMKKIALNKLENMITILGFPEFITDPNQLNVFYENLRICKWDNYGNSRRIRAFKHAYLLSQIHGKNRAFWDKSPFETNAYYNRPNNRVIIPIAMLNGEFFGSGNRILDYGRLGSIIGHEITHGFDTAGQKYDANGLLNGWGNSSIANYTKCFIDQYSKYYISEIGSYVNATITLDENLADNGGTKESYKAMKELADRQGITETLYSGYTTDQLFFIGFGTMWCNNPSQSYLLKQQTDPHAPAKWRVNGVVSNMKEFSEAFSCPSGSPMNPLQKCRMW